MIIITEPNTESKPLVLQAGTFYLIKLYFSFSQHDYYDSSSAFMDFLYIFGEKDNFSEVDPGFLFTDIMLPPIMFIDFDNHI